VVVLAVLSIAITPPAVVWLKVHREPPPSQSMKFYGDVYRGNMLDGQRASMRLLSQKIHKYPHCEQFRIERYLTWYPSNDDWDIDGIVYNRTDHTILTYNSGAEGYNWGKVTDECIDRLAQTGGNARDFGHLGCSDLTP
jgi:hypothetical protein